MAKFSAILFLFLFTVTATELGQLLKLPVLVQHFYKHQAEEKLSLIAFLAEHYIGDHNDEDKQEDLQLPFKNTLNTPSLGVFLIQPEMEILHTPPPYSQKHVSLQDSFIPSKIVFQVFHPPRLVKA